MWFSLWFLCKKRTKVLAKVLEILLKRNIVLKCTAVFWKLEKKKKEELSFKVSKVDSRFKWVNSSLNKIQSNYLKTFRIAVSL